MSSEASASGRSERETPKGMEPRIKGVAVRGTVAALKERQEETEPKVPAHLLHYLDERILVASWYPEAEYMDLLKVVAETYAERGRDVWFWIGQQAASRDLSTLYEAMVHEGQPSTTLKRFPKLWRLYRTAGHVKVQTIGTTKGVVRLYDYPFVTAEFARMIGGYLSRALKISGAEKVVVNTTSLGSKVGTSCIWALSWT